MKMKKLLLIIAATFGMTALTMAQNVPNYVPTNGLVGWWPFNGNANDESGNGNNGTVNGATTTTDRFGNSNSAYNFAGGTSRIVINNSLLPSTPTSYSISFWVYSTTGTGEVICDRSTNSYNYKYRLHIRNDLPNSPIQFSTVSGSSFSAINGSSFNQSNWSHVLCIADITANTTSLFVNGQLTGTDTHYYPNQLNATTIGANLSPGFPGYDPSIDGKIDDLGIWDRALTQQEITNSSICANNTTITPQTNTLTTGSAATFTANTSDPNPSYVWQSDFGQGFQTLNNFGNYLGTNTGSLNIANVQLPNHTQSIRVITTSGNCIDTSNVATIAIADTCINTITDTTLITVTDTLLINTTITELNPPNNANTIKVFPNPTNDHITINYGNFSVMNGYQLKIENSLGQQVFQTDITQQSDYLNLSSWGGNGLYFVHIIDPQGNTIDIRKIVLQ